MKRNFDPVIITPCDECGGRFISKNVRQRLCKCAAGYEREIEDMRRFGITSSVDLVSAFTAPTVPWCEQAQIAIKHFQNGADTITLIGPPGTGKTKLAAMMLNAYYNSVTHFTSQGVPGRYHLGSNDLIWVRAGGDLGEKTGRSIGVLERAMLVVFDEVTIGRPVVEASHWSQERQISAIRKRYGDPMIVTMNVVGEDPDQAEESFNKSLIPDEIKHRLRSHLFMMTGEAFRR